MFCAIQLSVFFEAIAIHKLFDRLALAAGLHPLLTGLLVPGAALGDKILLLAYGFAEILPDRVVVLAQIAERAEDIDVARAEAAEKRARARLDKSAIDVDFERAQVSLLKSLVRLQVASKAHIRQGGM